MMTTGGSRRLQQPAQHVLQDAAMAEILDLVERIDPTDERDGARAAGPVMDRQSHLHARLDAVFDTGDVEDLGALETERLPARPILELQRQHTHADEVGAVDALEAL